MTGGGTDEEDDNTDDDGDIMVVTRDEEVAPSVLTPQAARHWPMLTKLLSLP